MVSVYIKALAIVALVFVANMLVVKNIEDQRIGEVEQKLQTMETESQIGRLMLLYMEQMNSTDKSQLCPALELQTDEQISRANQLAYQIDKYREAS
jgi:hypothetical protein